MNQNVATVLNELKGEIIQSYGDRLSKLILYGSYARGDENSDSDIDVLVVLRDVKINRAKEIEVLSKSTVAILNKYGMLISAMPFSEWKIQHEDSFFIGNVLREGIII